MRNMAHVFLSSTQIEQPAITPTLQWISTVFYHTVAVLVKVPNDEQQAGCALDAANEQVCHDLSPFYLPKEYSCKM